jgi:hypothetical protein
MVQATGQFHKQSTAWSAIQRADSNTTWSVIGYTRRKRRNDMPGRAPPSSGTQLTREPPSGVADRSGRRYP